MNASELMIGDWVRTPDGIGTIRTIKEESDYAVVYVDNLDCYFRLQNIEPIELTKYILDRNGWKYENYCDECGGDDEYYIQDCFDIHINGTKYEIRCIDAINIQLDYVHQLQHALKVVGIEKEIVL